MILLTTTLSHTFARSSSSEPVERSNHAQGPNSQKRESEIEVVLKLHLGWPEIRIYTVS